MAITLSLRYATPDWLIYLAIQDGVISSPPVAADGLVTLPNDGGVTPDLQTDILRAKTDPPGAAGGVSGLPLQDLIRARLDGHGPLGPGALTQAEARALFLSDNTGGILSDQVTRARTWITPRSSEGSVQWAADANVDGDGDPVIEVRSSVGVAADAFLYIHLRHTFDL